MNKKINKNFLRQVAEDNNDYVRNTGIGISKTKEIKYDKFMNKITVIFESMNSKRKTE